MLTPDVGSKWKAFGRLELPELSGVMNVEVAGLNSQSCELGAGLVTNGPAAQDPPEAAIWNLIAMVCGLLKVRPSGTTGGSKPQKVVPASTSGVFRATCRERPPELPSMPVGSVNGTEVASVKPVNSFSSYWSTGVRRLPSRACASTGVPIVPM